jgi:MFS family permease
MSRSFAISSDNNKLIFAWIIFLFATLLVDSSIIRIYYFGLSQSAVTWIMGLFIAISVIFLASQYLMFNFVRKRSAEIRTRQVVMNRLYKMVLISQILLAITLLLVVFQISTISRYSVMLLTIATMISYFTSMSLMGFLGYRFITWFKSNRTPVLFLYGLACIVLTISGGFAVSLVSLILSNVPAFASQHVGTGYPYFSIGSATYLVSYGYSISTVLTFFIWWIASILVLRHYSEKWGSKKYIIIISMPLVFFLIQFQPVFFSLFSVFLNSEPVLFSILYTVAFTLSKPVGGILFSIIFWTTSRKLISNIVVRNYLIISAFGLMLLFISNQAVVLVTASYPPFGLATVSFMGLSSFFVFIGIYASAISVAEDAKLRRTIRKYALSEANLLDSIGMALVEDKIRKKVLKVAKEHQKNLMELTGIEHTLNEAEVNQYLNEVIQEIKKKPPKK